MKKSSTSSSSSTTTVGGGATLLLFALASSLLMPSSTVHALSPSQMDPSQLFHGGAADPSTLAGYSYGESCLFGGQHSGGFNPFLNDNGEDGVSSSPSPSSSSARSHKQSTMTMTSQPNPNESAARRRFSPEYAPPAAFVPKKTLEDGWDALSMKEKTMAAVFVSCASMILPTAWLSASGSTTASNIFVEFLICHQNGTSKADDSTSKDGTNK
eukprot:CAMPEP_0119571018 /NCGR_PEP_ID=MMETSP1352-20130426/43909_1 /TAXON_ID=265584 /ORGANISM="Stauroneis constricta, Strain CCMP1120" /LENGTH=212 /DNA_ID=CAMNT_0007620695 /DNA_START=67 /DNA_END=706 /DNA_ORIENTATION=-